MKRTNALILLWLALMAPGLASARVFPVEGFWFNRSKPGSGLSIAYQSDVLVIVVYTYDDDGKPVWGLASGRYEGEETFTAPLFFFNGGSPMQAVDFVPAEITKERSISLRFFGDVYASLSIDGSAPQPVVPFQFGSAAEGRNVVSPFEEVDFLIPDLDAAWLLTSHQFGASYNARFESDGNLPFAFEPIPAYDPLHGRIPIYRYENGDSTPFYCETTARTPDLPDACWIIAQDDINTETQDGIYMFPVSSIDWHIWRGTLFFKDKDDPFVTQAEFDQPQPPERRFVVHRLGNSSYDAFDRDFNSDRHAFFAADGFWWIPERPGSGLFIERKASVMVVTLYTYDEAGTPQWYLASGQMETSSLFVGELNGFANGSPFDSDDPEHVEPGITGSRQIRMEFTGSDFANVSIDGGAPFAVRSFNFAYPQRFPVQQTDDGGDVHDRSFPDLTGHWEFAALNPRVDRSLSLMIGEPFATEKGFAYSATDPAAVVYEIKCAATGSLPGCLISEQSSGRSVLRFDARNVGTARILAEIADDQGDFGEQPTKAWGFRIEPSG